MRIISYNVNGLRAALRKGFAEWLAAARPDIICLQEVRALRKDLELKDIEALGYHIYLHPSVKAGYAGVGILSLKAPLKISGIAEVIVPEAEGRILKADYPDYCIISVYMPSGALSTERQDFKIKWIKAFYGYISEVLGEGRDVIIGGDFNICHETADIHDAVRLDGYPGFTREERNWMTTFLGLGFTDAFRSLHPGIRNYTWWSYRSGARKRNLGWRIDYLLVSGKRSGSIRRAVHLPEAAHSDHCPVLLELAD